MSRFKGAPNDIQNELTENVTDIVQEEEIQVELDSCSFISI